jgi:hypothetical protein
MIRTFLLEEEEMAANLYQLRNKAVMVLISGGRREAAHLLQLSVEHALSQDSQRMVDSVLVRASEEWEGSQDIPNLVVMIGCDGVPRPGSPIFAWHFCKRAYCFDHELPAPLGYLGERELGGYHFRTVKEQEYLNDLDTARRIDEGTTKVYKDFWKGSVFQSGEEFLRSRERHLRSQGKERRPKRDSQPPLSPRVSKILTLIRFIERKGNSASPADLHFLGCLKDKVSQLGYPN